MPDKKDGFFSKLASSMRRTREGLGSRINELVQYYKEIDDDFFEGLTDTLVASDVGAALAEKLVAKVREQVRKEKIGDPTKIRALLCTEMESLIPPTQALVLPKPSVILMVGVNGAGKTTACGKLAQLFRAEGKSVMLAAADTFRAAAVEQLCVWGERAGVPVISQSEGSDPAAVVFDAARAARSRGTDVLICDTAGRLQNKVNLMNELAKVRRVLEREYADAHTETFLVLDATTGQNALSQAEIFGAAASVTGLILTKLDGTAKGGVALSITSAMDIPIRYVGVGEGIEDIEPFDAQAFTRAMFE